MPVRVLVMPVMVDASGGRGPLLSALTRPDRSWINGTVPRGNDADQVAKQLLQRGAHSIGLGDVFELLRPKPVRDIRRAGFQVDGAEMTLIYTMALPMGWVTVPSVARRLLPLTDPPDPNGPTTSSDAHDGLAPPPKVHRSDSRAAWCHQRGIVLQYWRSQLERTFSVVSFLPLFFTDAQVRSVYGAIWARKDISSRLWIDWSTTTARDKGLNADSDILLRPENGEARGIRWAYRKVDLSGWSAAAQRPATQDLVQRGFTAYLHSRENQDVAGPLLSAAQELLMTYRSRGWVGFSTEAVKDLLGDDATVGEAVMAVLAGAIAFQTTTTGRPSPWFKREGDLHEAISPRSLKPFSPRPAWARSVGVSA